MKYIRWNLYISAILTCTLYYAPIGYNADIVNNPEDIISNFTMNNFHNRYGTPTDDGTTSALWSTMVAFLAVGQLLGSVAAPLLCDRLGRKFTLSYVCCPLAIISAAIFIVGKYTKYPELLYVGRFISGLRVGMSATSLSAFIMESSPDDVRGAVGSMMDFTACLGVFISFLLSLPYVFGTEAGWVWLLSLDLWLGLIGLASSLYLHESPKYLYLVKKDEEKTSNALRFYHGKHVDIAAVTKSYRDEEISTRRARAASNALTDASENARIKQANKAIRKRYFQIYVLSAMVGIIPAANGYLALGAFSTPILRKAGIPSDTAKNYAFVMGAAELAGGTASMIVNHRCPRRLVLLTVTFFIIICDTIMAVTLSLGKNFGDDAGGYELRNAGAISLLIMATVTTMGPFPLIAIIPAELAPIQIRARACSVCFISMALGYIVTEFTILPLYIALNAWIFLAFAAMTSAVWLYLYFYLDETNPRFVVKKKQPASSRRSSYIVPLDLNNGEGAQGNYYAAEMGIKEKPNLVNVEIQLGMIGENADGPKEVGRYEKF